MSETSRKTFCIECAHRNVCQYKDKYLDLVEQIRNSSIKYKGCDGKMSTTLITDIDFVTLRDPLCKYYSFESSIR